MWFVWCLLYLSGSVAAGFGAYVFFIAFCLSCMMGDKGYTTWGEKIILAIIGLFSLSLGISAVYLVFLAIQVVLH